MLMEHKCFMSMSIPKLTHNLRVLISMNMGIDFLMIFIISISHNILMYYLIPICMCYEYLQHKLHLSIELIRHWPRYKHCYSMCMVWLNWTLGKERKTCNSIMLWNWSKFMLSRQEFWLLHSNSMQMDFSHIMLMMHRCMKKMLDNLFHSNNKYHHCLCYLCMLLLYKLNKWRWLK